MLVEYCANWMEANHKWLTCTSDKSAGVFADPGQISGGDLWTQYQYTVVLVLLVLVYKWPPFSSFPFRRRFVSSIRAAITNLRI